MNKKIGWIAILVLTSLSVSYLLMDLVREYISIPYNQIMKFFYRADQGMLWFFVLGVVAFISYKALVRVPSLPEFQKKQPNQRGPVAEMIYTLEMSQEGIYSRGKLKRHLKNMAIDIMALQRRTSPALIEQSIKNGTLSIPLEIRPFFEGDENGETLNKNPGGSRVFSKKDKLPKIDIEPLLRYLENEMDMRKSYED